TSTSQCQRKTRRTLACNSCGGAYFGRSIPGGDNRPEEQALARNPIVGADLPELAVGAAQRVEGVDQHLGRDVVLGRHAHDRLVRVLLLVVAGELLERGVVVAVVVDPRSVGLGQRNGRSGAVLRPAGVGAVLLGGARDPESVGEDRDLQLERLLGGRLAGLAPPVSGLWGADRDTGHARGFHRQEQGRYQQKHDVHDREYVGVPGQGLFLFTRAAKWHRRAGQRSAQIVPRVALRTAP